ncbi:hypothetical protein NLI96_g12696 [Meripilus lineatus]|uniref:Uncharacterized protein n=1 Tax=Meripilus lineatus TaxID=2056292 RepID=A0AAD5UPK9_9APHY|nr:hypothetical protein NLI96_g12696 [Physisporinus lineatus]
MLSMARILSILTNSSSKRCDPSILKLADAYNKLVRDIINLIAKGSAPRGARVPPLIEREGIFALDVDDTIWEDVDTEETLNTSKWLCDEDTQRGIRLILQLDRCEEEEEQLRKERCILQEWFEEEWVCTAKALQSTGPDSDMGYQLRNYQNRMLRLCHHWRAEVCGIPPWYPLEESWGLSAEEFDCSIVTDTSETSDVSEVESDGDEGDNFSDTGDDAEFFEQLEAHAMSDGTPQLVDVSPDHTPHVSHRVSKSPKKRSRRSSWDYDEM